MADDVFDLQDVRAAEALDADIERALHGAVGPGTEPIVALLATAIRAEPPPGLAARIEREHAQREQRRWRPVQIAAAALAALLLSQGIGNIVNGEWVARGIGEDFSPHTMREGGFALIGLGLAVAAGVFRRRWLPVSAAAGVPVGVALGINGIPELGQFAAGAALHTSEGIVALVLAFTFWRAHRYARGSDTEGGA